MPAEELLPFDLDNATGPQLKALRQALVTSFTRASLTMFLSEELSKPFDTVVAPAPFGQQVFQLLATAKREGWLGELVHKAIEANPKAPALRRFLETFELLGSAAPEPARQPRKPRYATGAGAREVTSEYQGKLRELGYSDTLAFQRHHPHLHDDKILGPATRAQIDREIAARSEAAGVAGPANASAAPIRHGATAANPLAPNSPTPSTPGMGARALERLFDSPSDYFDPSWLERLGDIRNRVCGIKGKGLLKATGCLVGPDLVLTCAYVLNGIARVAEEVTVQFDFVVKGEQPAPGREYPLHPTDWRVASSPYGSPGDEQWARSLDFVLLRLATPAGQEMLEGDERRGWIDLEVDPGRLAVGEMLFMLHHPRAGPMQMSVGQILATGHGDSRIWHNVTSEPGSGGAPVLDRRLRLVGLHELGMAKPDGQFHLAAVRADHIAKQLQAEGLLPQKSGVDRSVAAPDADN